MSELPENYKLGRAILGGDLILPEDIVRSGIFKYSPDQLKHYAETLPEKDALRRLRDTGFALVAGPPEPSSLFDLTGLRVGGKFVAEEKVDTRWFAFQKEPVADSTQKTWIEQNRLLREKEYVPTAVELFWGVVAFHLARKQDLFQGIYVRTNSFSETLNARISIGHFGKDLPKFAGNFDDHRQERTGLSCALQL